MANPHRGEVGFKAGDKSYTLSYSADAICQLEDALDRSVNDIGADMQDPKKLRMKNIKVMFWAGLIDHHPEMKVDDTAALMKHLKPVLLMKLIGKAFTLAHEDDEEGADEKPAGPQAPVQPAPGTGPVS